MVSQRSRPSRALLPSRPLRAVGKTAMAVGVVSAVMLSAGEAASQTQPPFFPIPGSNNNQPRNQPGNQYRVGGPTNNHLTRSEREDSGRGLEWFYFAPRAEAQMGSLTGLSGGEEVASGTFQVDPQFGAGIGARLLFYTIGLNGFYRALGNGNAIGVGPEVGVHMPYGDLEPYARLSGGYLAPQSVTLSDGQTDLDAGFFVGLRVGGKYYLSPAFSLGLFLGGDTVFLSKPGAVGGGSVAGIYATGGLQLGLHL